MSELFARLLSFFKNNLVRLFKKRHKRNINSSRKLLIKLRTFDSEPTILAYLRKIDPYVFEELILSRLEQDGFTILRNSSYSGDGGMDGSVFLPKRGWAPIQAKRYKAHINPSHVKALQDLSLSHKSKIGIFVHTGITGQKSKDMRSETMVIISGFTLAKWLSGKLSLKFDGSKGFKFFSRIS